MVNGNGNNAMVNGMTPWSRRSTTTTTGQSTMVTNFEEIWASLCKFRKINFMSDSMEQMDGWMES
jgi:hypothetical protein